jgi:hypothetical protein
MSFKVKTLAVFERKAGKLSKKYPSLKGELLELVQSLKENPQQGTSLGKSCYKIRIAIASKRAGKSAGGRVITCVKIVKETVYLLTVFDKSEQDSISDKELAELLGDIPE